MSLEMLITSKPSFLTGKQELILKAINQNGRFQFWFESVTKCTVSI